MATYHYLNTNTTGIANTHHSYLALCKINIAYLYTKLDHP